MKKSIQAITIFLISLLMAGFYISCDSDDDDNPVVGEWYDGGKILKVNTGNPEYDKIIEDKYFRSGDPSYYLTFRNDGTYLTYDGETGSYSIDGNILTVEGEIYTLSDDKRTLSSIPEDWTSYIQNSVSYEGNYQGVPTTTVIISATRTNFLKKK
jgi:uncharacterized protein YxeA